MRNFREYRFVVGETHRDANENRVVDHTLEVSEVVDSLGTAIRKAFINTGYREVLRVL